MAGPYTQDTRIAKFKTPYEDKDTELVLHKFDGIEGVSELFEYRIEALCAKPEILDFNDLLGEHCSVALKTLTGSLRWFDGVLTETQCLGVGEGGLRYRLVLRPWLWVLSRRRDSWIFHNMKAPQIIAEIFADYPGLADFVQLKNLNNYPTLEYCVQYRESDMDFVCRLMEQHGIHYHFIHSEGRHQMILGDDSAAWVDVPKSGDYGTSRPFFANPTQNQRAEEHLATWVPERRFTTGVVTLKDYNFKTPTNKLETFDIGQAKHALSKLESYDFASKHTDEAQGKFYAKQRMESHRASDERFLTSGDCASFYPGSLFTLERHFSEEQNDKEYLVLRCTHSIVSETYRSGAGGDLTEAYIGSYECMRSDKPYAPPMVTEKPYVHGPQTAVVVGSSEIPTDKYGRVHVLFHWDRAPGQSMWCRVSQIWASKEWGTMFIPRTGMEVIVEYLEGDPDLPIIVGCVYNAANMPPWPLEGEKNVAGFKSNSTEGGGGYNEFVLIDTKDAEVIRTHAQKDMQTKILNDETRHILHDRKTTIDNDEDLTVNGNRTTKVVKNRTTEVVLDDKLTVKKTLTVDVTDQITIKCGASSITMYSNGNIDIAGADITIKGTGSVLVEATKNLTTKATMNANHEATAEMTIKGMIVHIN